MKFDVNMNLVTGIEVDCIVIYPKENRVGVNFKLDIDQNPRKAYVVKGDFLANETREGAFTLDLSRAVVKAIKDMAKIDKNAADIVDSFWGVPDPVE